jgi:hypothetical protein
MTNQFPTLPVGKPNGSDIFTQTGANTLTSDWEFFSANKLRIYQGKNRHIHTLVTIDRREDEAHICFTQDPDPKRAGIPAENCIEQLAGLTLERLRKTNADLKSSQLHFYLHHTPTVMKEQFIQIKMQAAHSSYARPEWNFYDVIPLFIQEALKNNPPVSPKDEQELDLHFLPSKISKGGRERTREIFAEASEIGENERIRQQREHENRLRLQNDEHALRTDLEALRRQRDDIEKAREKEREEKAKNLKKIVICLEFIILDYLSMLDRHHERQKTLERLRQQMQSRNREDHGYER